MTTTMTPEGVADSYYRFLARAQLHRLATILERGPGPGVADDIRSR